MRSQNLLIFAIESEVSEKKDDNGYEERKLLIHSDTSSSDSSLIPLFPYSQLLTCLLFSPKLRLLHKHVFIIIEQI